MIDLYKFVPQFGMRDASPFCLKLETYLRFAGLDYQTNQLLTPAEAPKQKLPYIIDGGETIADSALCILYLKDKYGDPLGEGLSAEQHAMGHAVRTMLEERTYWLLTYTRWLKPEYQPVTLEAWFGQVPEPMRSEITKGVVAQMEAAMQAHGIGKHTEEEIFAFGVADLKAVEAVLGDKDYLLGDNPSEYDATVYGLFANIVAEPFKTPLSVFVRSSKSLMAYVERVEKKAFGPD